MCIKILIFTHKYYQSLLHGDSIPFVGIIPKFLLRDNAFARIKNM